MRRTSLYLCVLSILAIGEAARANILVELSFQQKLAESDVVIVGTVTSGTPRVQGQRTGTATVMTLATLKGTPEAQHIVRTQSRIPEEDPQCCQVGATYVMFLARPSEGSGLISVNGRFGMIRIGPADNDPKIEVIRPEPEGSAQK